MPTHILHAIVVDALIDGADSEEHLKNTAASLLAKRHSYVSLIEFARLQRPPEKFKENDDERI
jgi:hypothetical protein